MIYCVGDVVTCRTSSDGKELLDVVFDDAKYRQLPTDSFEIVGSYQDSHYILLVSRGTKDSFEITNELAVEHSINIRHCGRFGYLVKEFAIGSKVRTAPLKCCCCGQYFQYAAPNQTDGRFACWSCKTDTRYQLIHNVK